MSTKDIIDHVIVAEGVSKVTNNPADGGGRTQYGISEKSNPQAWLDGKVTEEEARAIYEQKYVKTPHFDQIPDPRLQAQLVDYGVTSGPYIATTKLQTLLQVTPDGQLGPETLEAVKLYEARALNNALVGERIKMICKIVQKNPSQLQFLLGWANRALEFIN